MANLIAIGFAEALSAPEVAWSLVDHGYEVVAFARRGRRSALRHSRYVTVHEITAPEKDTTAAWNELTRLLTELGQSRRDKNVLLPLDDAFLWLGSRLELSSQWLSAGPRREQAEVALDKSKQIERARAAGFAIPETAVVNQPDELAPFESWLPIILRPVHAAREHGGALRKGANWICADRTELNTVAQRWRGLQPLLVQRYISGTGEGIFGLSTVSGIVAWSAHRRLRMMNPHGSGSSACVSEDVGEEVKSAAEKFLRSMEWRGLFMIELLRAADGRIFFVEFNGRAWGSMALARRQGLEYPAWAVAATLDPSFMPAMPASRVGKIECSNVGRELMHLLFVLRGPKSAAVKPWPSFSDSLSKMLSPGNPRAFYNYRGDDKKVFLADTLQTLRGQLLKGKS
ncbi:MAG: hypothetical protein M3Y86_10545 [Verrucomicrobiota bacterium]|nr:hypothetical protein [Verrucomicrobiota bacterium]